MFTFSAKHLKSWHYSCNKRHVIYYYSNIYERRGLKIGSLELQLCSTISIIAHLDSALPESLALLCFQKHTNTEVQKLTVVCVLGCCHLS